MKMGWDFRVDDFSHYLHLPRFIQDPICDWFEKRLLGPEEYANQKEFMRKLYEEEDGDG